MGNETKSGQISAKVKELMSKITRVVASKYEEKQQKVRGRPQRHADALRGWSSARKER